MIAGIVTAVALTLVTDLVLHAMGFFPPAGQPASSGPLVVATLYRVVFGVLGSYVSARLAPNRPSRFSSAPFDGVYRFSQRSKRSPSSSTR